MLISRVFRLIHDKRLSVPVLRCFHHEFSKPPTEQPKEKEAQVNRNPFQTLVGGVQNKYKVFRDDEAPEIFDVEEARHQEQQLPDESDEALDQYYGLNLKRGIRGVFDVEDLVELLRKENVDDIFVCYVPEDLKYVDHLVVCSGRSYRHMISTAEFVRRMFKIKRTKGDILPRIEGDKSRDWMAMDLGGSRQRNIPPSCAQAKLFPYLFQATLHCIYFRQGPGRSMIWSRCGPLAPRTIARAKSLTIPTAICSWRKPRQSSSSRMGRRKR
ncbi:blast:Mitochondrial assembly of ribosomal large subunit protein 1 [Drosophila guanche]|uniref:Blast:Mitochondrial assembly of ribosomal large subunit protein 1 n=1 Tax=Drosophila guanche TaxID=7266 RepID=A0A3B0JZM3_DROGU|nr:blast:Mitochondrial assembly of ribosomal large subunit protein 1 [Drosophila guanche]